MHEERAARRARHDERLPGAARKNPPRAVESEVEAITGSRPTLDDFLSAEATERLAERSLTASALPATQRQTWTNDLVAEMHAAVLAAAERLIGGAYWLQPLSSGVGAVNVPTDALLDHAASMFTSGDPDLVLANDDGETGLLLA